MFIEGTEPAETALPPDVMSLQSFALEQAAAGFAAPDAGAPDASAEPEPDAGLKP